MNMGVYFKYIRLMSILTIQIDKTRVFTFFSVNPGIVLQASQRSKQKENPRIILQASQ